MNDTRAVSATVIETQRNMVRSALHRAAHFLPSQGPISTFIHHNTLHSLQHLEFDEAVNKGHEIFGGEPYLPESRFREELTRGRITVQDLMAVLGDELQEGRACLIAGLATRLEIRASILQHVSHTATSAELNWLMQESDALQVFIPGVSTDQQAKLLSDTRKWVTHHQDPSRIFFRASRDPMPSKQTAAFSESTNSALRTDKLKASEWQRLCLSSMWRLCQAGVRKSQYGFGHPSRFQRIQDLLGQQASRHPDDYVNELLIKFTAAFIDQGLAHWGMPERQQGYWLSFRQLFSSRLVLADAWRRKLPKWLRDAERRKLEPIDSIIESLQHLGVDEGNYFDAVLAEFLSLKGFAGMLQQVADRPNQVLHSVPQTVLEDYLAVRLLLARCAVDQVARDELGWKGPPEKLVNWVHDSEQTIRRQRVENEAESQFSQTAFTLFQLSQLFGWSPPKLESLAPEQWFELVQEVDQFSSIPRRRVFQLAFERRFQQRVLGALTGHRTRQKPQAGPGRPKFQAVFCIDDREESFRRHLEEVEPACQTFGMAGFFGVVMYFKGQADAHFTALCPVVLKPQHFVREEPVFSLKQKAVTRGERRAWLGRWTHDFHLSSRTLAAGWLGTSLLGSLATIPMVARIVAPRATSRVRALFSSWVRPPEVTELHLERTQDPPGEFNGHLGFSIDEMAAMVKRLLEDIGLVHGLSRLVVIVGHGSSSLNNPHESAYNCGACSGAKGGPNARAVTQMANDPRVRRALKALGLEIPDDSFFLGAFHNTCNDEFEWFDLERVPVSHRELVEEVFETVNQVRQRNAHERARRFESFNVSTAGDAALRHVEGRAQDLSQARPEYNHATNALCLVGRRAWSRNLFLDRRAFLISYDPAGDDELATVLSRILQAAVPVCGGINLEYYFSTVDNECYGAGNKLPHNITSLLGVMTGAESDLRPGLSAQMVEIHEPQRLLFVVEASPQALEKVLNKSTEVRELVVGKWVHLACFDPQANRIQLWREGGFVPFEPEPMELPIAADSLAWTQGLREDLPFASIGVEFVVGSKPIGKEAD